MQANTRGIHVLSTKLSASTQSVRNATSDLISELKNCTPDDRIHWINSWESLLKDTFEKSLNALTNYRKSLE